MKTPETMSPNATLGLLRQMAAMVEQGTQVPMQHLAITLRQSHDTTRELMTRTGTLAKRNETLEAEVALLRRICYGSQKGGAA